MQSLRGQFYEIKLTQRLGRIIKKTVFPENQGAAAFYVEPETKAV
jgi:hypothetical protein